MNVDLRYLGRSRVERSSSGGELLSFAPNLARPAVFYDGQVRHPIRFREAISALHDVVIGDHRFKKRDKAAYIAWREQEEVREAELRTEIYNKTKRAEIERIAREPLPPNLDSDFRRLHSLYWTARRRWASELASHDPELFRHLVPCDPVVTVAPDVVFFECFAKDESSYGCLVVDRDGFENESKAGLGTTNVDYSMALYEHFQGLRSYRATRLQVDPTGFEVKVEGHADYREEKIDLPPSWLRGFGQISAAMGLPGRRVELSTDAVYSLLAYLRRHREKSGPRSLRFVLEPGKRARFVIEPFGVEIESHGAVYDGERPEEIKVWGRRRLMVLARILPLCERIEVVLLGSGLPSVWIAHMGEMRLVLALSGWTRNDWSSGAALDLISGGFRSEPRVLDAVKTALERDHRLSYGALSSLTGAQPEVLLGSLQTLAKQGQCVYDFSAEVFRWRPILPVALSESLIGPDHPELVAARDAWRSGRVKVQRDSAIESNRRMVVGTVNGTKCEAVIDADGVIRKGTCSCSYFFKSRMRQGPCQHLLGLRMQAQTAPAPSAGSSKGSSSAGAGASTSAGKAPSGERPSEGPKWYEKWFK
ncbi:MAG: SWIM zinc finger family protein [Myxococcales bacterium]|nr:SWIM zinc finger family protein [Myxococcales bacterium]